MMAESLGSRLLAEVEEVGLDEIFRSLRREDESNQEFFGLPTLDHLVQVAIESTKSSTKRLSTPPPVIELTSVAPGDGKTHLLYHFISLSILPQSLDGKHACAILIDTDGTFSIARLAKHVHQLISERATRTITETEKEEILSTALNHLHIFRPQSHDSLVATLHNLPNYLFSTTSHKSIDRRVALLALDSASVFYWQNKADDEYASYIASNKPGNKQQPARAPGYARLTNAIRSASSTFECPVVFTTWKLSQIPHLSRSHELEIRALRPALPAPLAQLPILRLIVQRLEVRKLPIGIGVEEAKRDAESRQQVVDRGRFEVVVNEWDIDERTLQKLQHIGVGLSFTIKDHGIAFDD